jgi:hypothetical protein
MARTGRISVRIENELRRTIKISAKFEEVSVADFCRRLFESAAEGYDIVLNLVILRRLIRWAAREYISVGHCAMLRRMLASEKGKRVKKGKEAA